MTPAENTVQTEGSAPAAGSELLIPKARLDEVLAENRRLKESEQIKDQLYLQDRQRMAAMSQPSREPEITPEETGLDPQMHQAVVKAAKAIAERTIGRERAVFEQQIGILANRTEKAELLATKGSDKAKYLPEIQAQQQAHYQRTGSFLPAEIALMMIQDTEKDARIKALEARLAGAPAPAIQAQGAGSAAAAQTQNPGSAPGAAGTRVIPGSSAAAGSAGSAQKSFAELSVEEMEARLEEQFGGGGRL